MNPTQRIKLRGPLTGGARIITEDDDDQYMGRKMEHRHSALSDVGTDYAREVKERETELYLRVSMIFQKNHVICQESVKILCYRVII